jgi:lactobin A/cerein 7B family class IIb bacteriocin
MAACSPKNAPPLRKSASQRDFSPRSRPANQRPAGSVGAERGLEADAGKRADLHIARNRRVDEEEVVMRELSIVELEQVDGGVAPLVVLAIGAGVIGLGGLGVLAYGVSKGCSGSLEISSEGIKVEVTCPGGKD